MVAGMGSNLQVDLKCNVKMLGYFHGILATIAPAGMSCPATGNRNEVSRLISA